MSIEPRIATFNERYEHISQIEKWAIPATWREDSGRNSRFVGKAAFYPTCGQLCLFLGMCPKTMRTSFNAMKRIVIAAGFAAILSACSAEDPNAQLDRIDKLLAENRSLTSAQVSEVTDYVANGKRLLAEGQKKKATSQFADAIKVLEKAGK